MKDIFRTARSWKMTVWNWNDSIAEMIDSFKIVYGSL